MNKFLLSIGYFCLTVLLVWFAHAILSKFFHYEMTAFENYLLFLVYGLRTRIK